MMRLDSSWESAFAPCRYPALNGRLAELENLDDFTTIELIHELLVTHFLPLVPRILMHVTLKDRSGVIHNTKVAEACFK